METGYSLNVAIVTTRAAWNSTPAAPLYSSTHYCRIDLGRDAGPALQKAADIAARFPEGDKPGQFKLSLTRLEAIGQGVDFARHVTGRDAGEAAAINSHNAQHAAHAAAHGWPSLPVIHGQPEAAPVAAGVAAQGEALPRAGGLSEATGEAIEGAAAFVKAVDAGIQFEPECDHGASRADGAPTCKRCGAKIDYPFR